MGAAASAKRIKPLPRKQAGITPRSVPDSLILESPRNVKNMVKTTHNVQMANITEESNLQKHLKEQEEKAKKLEQYLAEAESNNLKLSDQVILLEEQLETVKKNFESMGSYEETIHAKDQYIQQLEAEVKLAQDQLSNAKINHKRRLKSLKLELLQTKQDAALTVMELKTMQNNLHHVQMSTRESKVKEGLGSNSKDDTADDRFRLIVELSNQVSQQQQRINQLEDLLQARNERVKQLEAELCSLTRDVTMASSNGSDDNMDKCKNDANVCFTQEKRCEEVSFPHLEDNSLHEFAHNEA
ncbi:coiled-coil domain-containing protein 192 [Protopterus annectens]|uniref:coiled-coil domain-containing protein 192 n=1 Tax=Protopterus annectens TaxID=7888 RepID=UPI001CFB6D5C|nr:coiled-coil domain-containing protein 192 [Protopterus annectens]